MDFGRISRRNLLQGGAALTLDHCTISGNSSEGGYFGGKGGGTGAGMAKFSAVSGSTFRQLIYHSAVCRKSYISRLKSARAERIWRATRLSILTRVVVSEHLHGNSGNDEADRQRLMLRMRDVPLNIAARLGAAPVPIAELSQLTIGDVIRLEARCLDKFIRNDRLFAVHDNVFFNGRNDVICSGRGTTIRPQ